MKKWIYSIALLLVGAGCDMTLLPETHITEEDVIENLADIEKCFMSAYRLKGAINAKINCDWAISDEVAPNFENWYEEGANFYFQDASKMYRSEWVESLYAGFYNSIAICNETLNQLELSPEKEEARWSQLKGEVLALRAYDHFSLVNYFGRPYYDHPETNPGIVLKTEFSLDEMPRSTVKTVYDTILSDLNRAYQLMNSDEEAPARFSKDGVTALLCRVNLFMNRWKKVIEEADKLIGKYKLPSKPAKQFQTINGKGEIFTLDFSYDKYGFFSYLEGDVSKQLLNTFQDFDERMNLFDIDEDFDITDEGEIIWIETVVLQKHATTYKALRIAEVYLNRAEAYCELGQDELAREDLKAIVENNGGESDYIDDLSGEELLAEILAERSREFMVEGYRATDLLRKGWPLVRYYTDGELDADEPQQTTPIEHFSRILPIPHRECYLNTRIDQNAGYPRDAKL